MTPQVTPTVSRIARLTAYAALGPITGPLVAGFIRNRKDAPILATLYAVAIPTTWLGLTATLGMLKTFIAG